MKFLYLALLSGIFLIASEKASQAQNYLTYTHYHSSGWGYPYYAGYNNFQYNRYNYNRFYNYDRFNYNRFGSYYPHRSIYRYNYYYGW